jgi:hypothetical protein
MKISGLRVVVVSLAAALACAGATGAARAGETHEYEIAANDGYGLEDCLSTGGECGHVVADAWCEAHGHGQALSFGLRSVVDERPTPVAATDESYVVKCGD